MSRRSVVIGFTLAVLLASWCYFSDHVVRPGLLIAHLMPVVVYGALVAFLLVLNPLLGRLRESWRLKGREVAVILALCLMACGVPGRFVQCLPGSIMLPHHDSRLRPGWKQENALGFVPERMLPDVSREQNRALNGFVTGLAEGDRHIGFFDVPWQAWIRSLAFWVPLMLCILAASLGLAAVFHRQWSHHEQLPYPISIFAHALIEPKGAVFRNRLFWTGFLIVFLIELNNYACRWWPGVLIPVTLRFDFSALARLAPMLVKGKGMTLFHPSVLFTVVGLAYFLSSDVCLAMVIGPFVYCCIAGIFMNCGVELRPGREMALSIEGFLYSGGYFGILLIVFYTGRHYYWNVLRRSLNLESGENVPPYAVWGMRLALGAFALAVVQLVCVGLAWPAAVMYVFFALMVYAVVSRIVAETGVFDIGTFVFPGVLIWGFFGASALGPEAMATMFVLSTVLLLCPRTAPMPFVVQALKLTDVSGEKIPKMMKLGALALVLTFAVALPVTIYWHYDRGAPTSWWPRTAATYPFENTVEAVYKLKAQGMFEEAVEARGAQRLGNLSPSWSHIAAFGAAAGLSILFGAGRLLFTHWPLHPVVFLFLGGSHAMRMTFSFFIGWLVKFSVTKYGGAQLYQKLKPLMFGLIAGAMLGKSLSILVGTLRYILFGKTA